MVHSKKIYIYVYICNGNTANIFDSVIGANNLISGIGMSSNWFLDYDISKLDEESNSN